MPIPASPLLRKLLLSLAALVLLAGLVWTNRHHLVENLLQPWLQERLEQALDGEVSWQALQVSWNRVSVHDLQIAIPGRLEGRIDRLVCAFEWPEVLSGRLAEVTLAQPAVSLTLSDRAGASPSPAPALPTSPPLQIESWQVKEGRLQATWPTGQLQIVRLNGSGRLTEDLSFQLAGQLADGQESELALAGGGRWREGLELTLGELRWREQSLLPEPVTLQPASPVGVSGRLTMKRLTAADAAQLLAVVGQQPPWPKGTAWVLEQPILSFRLTGNGPRFEFTSNDGSVTLDDQSLAWTKATAEIRRSPGDPWQARAALSFGASGRLLTEVELQEATLSGRLEFSVVEPRGLTRYLGLPEMKELDRLQRLRLVANLEAGADRTTLSAGNLSGQVAEIGALAGSFSGEWREGQLTADLASLTMGDDLVKISARLEDGDAEAGWSGRLRISCRDIRPLLRAWGWVPPENLPLLDDLRLESGFGLQGGSLVVSDAELQAAVVAERLTGKLAMRGSASWGTGQGLRLAIERSSLAELEFTNRAGTIVLAGGRLNVSGTAHQEPSGWQLALRGQARLGEALIHSWYADLSSLPVQFELAGTAHPDLAQVNLRQAELRLEDLLNVRLEGRLSGREGSLAGRVETGPLGGKFEQVLGRLAGDLWPQVAHLDLDGRLAIEPRFAYRPEAWDLELQLIPRNLSLGWQDSWQLRNLKGTLPVMLGQPAERTLPPPRQHGRLTWEALQAPLLQEGEAGELAVTVTPNSVDLSRPVELRFADGRIRLQELAMTFGDLAPKLRATAQLERVDLGRITRQLGWPEMVGRLSAELNDVHVDRELIRTDGEVSAKLFGGELTARNLRVEKPLSRYPTYLADIDFSGIDLAALTQTFAFGEINGVADGYVHDLRLFNRIPSAFRARFETREQGTRNISVKAIRNLNALSQGGLSAALSQGIYQFIDFYHYRKIGLLCTLQNDLFHIEGTAKPGSDKYLVYGSWLPPKIDVVISSPTISFEEMVGRLQRIERTGR